MGEIYEKVSFCCPVCKKQYDTKEEAELCYKAFDFREKFMQYAKPYHWFLIGNKFSDSLRLIMASEINPDYSHSVCAPCKVKGVSLFSLFGNGYYDVYDMTNDFLKMKKWNNVNWMCCGMFGISEAFEKYKIVPPINWIENENKIPSDVLSELKLVAKMGFQLREREINLAHMRGTDLVIRNLAILDCECFMPKQNVGIPTEIISGENLYNIDKDQLPMIKVRK